MNVFIYLITSMQVEDQFEDMTCEMVSALNLAPITPATADVDESDNFSFLSPFVPAEADFE